MSARTSVSPSRRRSGTGTRRPGASSLVVLCLVAGSACATAAVDRSPDQTRTGVSAANQGYWEEAEFRWRKALAIRGDDARALNNLAIRFERLGEFVRARDYYERAQAAASEGERFYIDQNWEQLRPILTRIQSGPEGSEPAEGNGGGDSGGATSGSSPATAGGATSDQAGSATGAAPMGVTALEILIEVPDQGPNLAGYDRILIGNFAPREGSEANINDVAVRYFRRRITQRTFFETQDQVETPLPPERRGEALLADRQFWVDRAADSRADLVFTGWIGLGTSEESRMVRERIRSPDGQVREVARFQDSIVYRVTLDYVVLQGSDGATLLEGNLEAEQSFPADEGVNDNEAVFEALEELLPQLLDAITPQRSEQSRFLIY